MIAKSEHVVIQEIEATGETALLDADREVVLVLNALGAAVWHLIDGKRSLAAIVEMIAPHFQVDKAQLTEDVRHFIEDLATRHVAQLDHVS